MKKKFFLGLGIALLSISASAIGHLKGEPTVYYSQNYEDGAVSDWSTQVGGRFDPEIGEDASGNHYLRAAAGTRTANGTGMYSNAYNEKLAAGTPFTMTADIHLRSANGQNGVEFTVGAAGASYNFSKWVLTGTMTLNMKQVSAGGTNQWILNGDADHPITLPGTETLAGTDAAVIYDEAPWYSIQLTWQDGLTFFSIKDKAKDSVIVDKKQLKTNDSFASVGGVGQLWFSTSRYNAAFAIDNVVIRDIIDGDLPVIVPTTYTLNYVHEGDGAVLKGPVVLNTTVGTEVTASSADMASFFNADKSMKYIYKEGNATIVASEDSVANVITLVYRDAAKMKYTVKSTGLPQGYEFDFTPYANPGDKFAEQWEGELVSVAYPQFVMVADSLWTCPAGKYVAKTFNYEFTITTSTKAIVEYTDNYDIMNVKSGTKFNKLKDIVYYKEGEEIWPENTCAAPNQYVRCSYGKAGAPALNEMAEIVTLPAGTYRVGMQFAQATTAAQAETFDLFIGEDTLFKAAIYGYVQSYQSPEFTITEDTKLYLKGLTVDGGGLDWIYVQKVVRIPANLAVEPASISMLGVGEKDTLTWTADNTATPVFESSDVAVASVGEAGEVESNGKGVAIISVILPATDYYYADTAKVEVTVKVLGILPALASNAYYSWQSPMGVVEEVGGSAVASEADPSRVNYSQAPAYVQYYTISLNGKKDLSDDKYTTVTLEKALAEGDTIYVYAFKNKGEEKKSGVKFLWGAEGTSSVMACGDDFPDLYFGGEPVLVKYVVPASAAGETVFRMSRSETGTNLFIAQLYIVPGPIATGINSVNENSLFNNGSVYNLRGMKVNSVKKGDIYINNGKKFIAK